MNDRDLESLFFEVIDGTVVHAGARRWSLEVSAVVFEGNRRWIELSARGLCEIHLRVQATVHASPGDLLRHIRDALMNCRQGVTSIEFGIVTVESRRSQPVH